jgi:thiol-disulfide isomerase/thioredoxin
LFACKLSDAQPVIKYPELEKMLNQRNDTVYVYNFWATWCVPCVKEIPSFVKLDSLYRNKKVKTVLVSLDFKRELDSRLKPFIEKNKITSQVFLLDENDYDYWIPRIDSSWGGAIPATLIVTKNKKYFYDKEFTFELLENTVKPLIN